MVITLLPNILRPSLLLSDPTLLLLILKAFNFLNLWATAADDDEEESCDDAEGDPGGRGGGPAAGLPHGAAEWHRCARPVQAARRW